MLVGETGKGPRTLWPTAAWFGGLAVGLVAIGLLMSRVPLELGMLAVVVSAAGFLAAYLLERRDARRRRFVINFGTSTLRLEFTSPIRGAPQTMHVPFERVGPVQLLEQADGRQCLTVDFRERGSPGVLREVLAANIPAEQAAQAERLLKVIENALAKPGGSAPAAPPG